MIKIDRSKLNVGDVISLYNSYNNYVCYCILISKYYDNEYQREYYYIIDDECEINLIFIDDYDEIIFSMKEDK